MTSLFEHPNLEVSDSNGYQFKDVPLADSSNSKLNLQVAIASMKCLVCLFSCARGLKTPENEGLSKSYFDVLFSKSPIGNLCTFLDLMTGPLESKSLRPELASEAPELKQQCLIIMRFICDQNPAELNGVLHAAPAALQQCLRADSGVLDQALPLVRDLCYVSPESPIIIENKCGQSLVSSLVS